MKNLKIWLKWENSGEVESMGIVLLRSQDIVSDSRVLKYEKIYKRMNIEYLILGWDRAGKEIKRDNTVYCHSKAGFQKGLAGAWGRLKLNFFFVNWLFRNYMRYKYIHACDLDTVLSALVMKCFGKIVIFDIFDWYSDEMRTGCKIIDCLIKILERFSVKFSDLVIICEHERLKQMKIIPQRYIVIRNMPSKVSEVHINGGVASPSIAYVGGLVKHRGLDELLEVAAIYPKIIVNIAGFGDDDIVEKIRKFTHVYKNIKYYGYLKYHDALRLMSMSSLLYAMYYTSNPNHVYAAPNKFYEGLLLRKPVLTNCGTLFSNMVAKYKTGYIISEGKNALNDFFSNFTHNLKGFDDDKTHFAYEELKKKQEMSWNEYIEFIDRIR